MDAPIRVTSPIRHLHYTSGDASGRDPTLGFGYLLERLMPAAAQAVAGIVVCHEIGHKLGLYPRAGPQYDPENTQGGHCTDNTCTMFWKWMEGAYKDGWCNHCVTLLRYTDVKVLTFA